MKMKTLSFGHYFDHQINGKAKHIDILKRLAPSFGLNIDQEYPESHEERVFGFKLIEGIVVQIANGSPAYKQLSLKDKIVSINGRPIGEANLVDETLTIT